MRHALLESLDRAGNCNSGKQAQQQAAGCNLDDRNERQALHNQRTYVLKPWKANRDEWPLQQHLLQKFSRENPSRFPFCNCRKESVRFRQRPKQIDCSVRM